MHPDVLPGRPTTDAAPAPTPDKPALARIWRYGARPLGGRTNGLNLIRLVLAAMVLFAHGFYLAGAGHGPMVNGEHMGGLAVMGFFAISGYLITGSRLRKPLGSYLLLRVSRIFPAFLVCLVVTAGVFAPLAYVHTHRSLDGFATTGTTPANFVFSNAALKMNAYDVAGTPSDVPFAQPDSWNMVSWNGSLWTLYYEFVCYLLIAVLVSVPLLRRSAWGAGVVLVVSVVAYANVERLLPYFGGNNDLRMLLRLLPFFMAGAWLYMVRDKMALTWPVAVGAAVVAAGPAVLVTGWGPQLVSPLLAYVVLYLGALIRSPRLVATHDISYGVYIYAWPAQQLLAIVGVHHLGLVVYDLAAVALTVPLAIASWLLVERPILERAHKVTASVRPRLPQPSLN
ncbi:MAG: acyltransferase [Micrococcales bacterium]|nr:acyltransferase [Micrococcales bacterium]MCL2668921.1 acyltransferase [Micrococcales bacterium]